MRGGSSRLLFEIRFGSLTLRHTMTVGKTTLATMAATALGWVHIGTDAVFERREQKSTAAYIAESGWDTFACLNPRFSMPSLKTIQPIKL